MCSTGTPLEYQGHSHILQKVLACLEISSTKGEDEPDTTESFMDEDKAVNCVRVRSCPRTNRSGWDNNGGSERRRLTNACAWGGSMVATTDLANDLAFKQDKSETSAKEECPIDSTKVTSMDRGGQ